MKILLLGGTGAMGMHLSQLLCKSNENKVFVTSRCKRESRLNLNYIRGNAHDNVFLETLLKTRYDAIVDFMVYKTDEFKARIENLLSATDHYVYLSSSRVYANSEDPITEESPRLLDVCEDSGYLLTDEYALTKGRQEDILRRQKQKNYTIIRPYITFSNQRLQLGVLEKENWLYRALNGRSIVFSEDIANMCTTLTHGNDVAFAISHIIGKDWALGEIFHITSNESYTWYEILDTYLKTIKRETGKEPEVKWIRSAINLRIQSAKYQVMYDRFFNRMFDNSKIEHFIPSLNIGRTLPTLDRCLSEFIKCPQFRTISFSLEALQDRKSGDFTSLSEMTNINEKLNYLIYRISPQFLIDYHLNK